VFPDRTRDHHGQAGNADDRLRTGQHPRRASNVRDVPVSHHGATPSWDPRWTQPLMPTPMRLSTRENSISEHSSSRRLCLGTSLTVPAKEVGLHGSSTATEPSPHSPARPTQPARTERPRPPTARRTSPGAAPQARVRHRPRDLPAMRRPAARHRQHRATGAHLTDPRAPRPCGRRRRSGAPEPRATRALAADLNRPAAPGPGPGRARVDRRPTPRAFHDQMQRFTGRTTAAGSGSAWSVARDLPSAPRIATRLDRFRCGQQAAYTAYPRMRRRIGSMRWKRSCGRRRLPGPARRQRQPRAKRSPTTSSVRRRPC